MHVAILSNSPDLSAYLGEMFKTWGLPLYTFVEPHLLPTLSPTTAPVLVCPASENVSHHVESLIAYARRGGRVICFNPKDTLASVAGLESEGEKEVPLRLRMTAYPAAGLAGELLPIVGCAEIYQHTATTRVLAYLSHPGRYHGESVGITETPIDHGAIVVFAFDLARCVMLLRQGDPDRAEFIPPGDDCVRPSHLAANIGPNDSGWIPYADLLSRLFVDLVRRYLRAPIPLLSHLPDEVPGILLYSGDEDNADVAANDDEFDAVTAAGGRMNLYIIPTQTQSTTVDVQRYAARHDVGPHPNLRPVDGQPVAVRVAEFERQVRMFGNMFHIPARSVRNHCTAWAGYLELVTVMEKLDIRMDANYLSGTYMRDRLNAPYAGFGSAMPMRFCQPDGHLLNVFQQHTHISDDVLFGPEIDYSYKLSPETFAIELDRTFTDIATRFHTPYGVCIHPGNWVRFSSPQGRALLQQATEQGIPIWSFDQWSEFWEARDTWRFNDLKWDGTELQFTAVGEQPTNGLSWMMPMKFAAMTLAQVQVDGQPSDGYETIRYREPVTLIEIPDGATSVSIVAKYSHTVSE